MFNFKQFWFFEVCVSVCASYLLMLSIIIAFLCHFVTHSHLCLQASIPKFRYYNINELTIKTLVLIDIKCLILLRIPILFRYCLKVYLNDFSMCDFHQWL